MLLWDVSHVTPQRLSMVSCGCKAVVSSTCLHEATGLLAAGHSNGEACFLSDVLGLQFSPIL